MLQVCCEQGRYLEGVEALSRVRDKRLLQEGRVRVAALATELKKEGNQMFIEKR